MDWQAHPFALALFLGAALNLGVARAAARREAPGARTCTVLMLALAWWAGGYGVELLTTTVAAQRAWARVEYLGVLTAPLAWWIFTLRFSGRDAWLTRPVLAALCLVPAILYALVLTDPGLHQLLYREARTVEVGGWRVLRVTYGPAGWANVAYAYACLLAGTLTIGWAFWTSPRLYRRQVGALLASAAAPWAANALYMLGIGAGIDLTPFGFSITGLCAVWALRHARLLDLTPVARGRLMESLDDGIAVVDGQGRVVDVNAACTRMLGHCEADLIGQPASTAFAAHAALLAALAGDGRGVLTVGAGAAAGVLEPRVTVLTDRRGRVIGRLVVLRDVTERRRVIAELERARDAAEALARAKAEFLATVSHEIRTPMNGVVGMTALLLGMPLPAEHRDCVETIRASGEQLLTIINQILDFSRAESGRLELEVRPFDLRAAVGGVLDLLRPQAEAGGLTLTLAVDARLPEHCLGDVTRLRQVVANLVGNAVKFTPAGRVEVRLDAEGGDDAERLYLRVRDTGIGIPAQSTGRLFQPFSQVDASTARQYGGSGLGLAICRRLCELMGGSITLDSQVGVGTTFHVRLPLRAAAAPVVAGAGPGAAAVAPTAPALRILVAEDNQVNQKVAMFMLARLGYHADLAANGIEAVAAAQRAAYDVVLMDVQMPEMDGIEATQHIRTGVRPVPRIIAMTANAMPSDREACLAAGMDDYLTKPVRIDALRAALARVAA